jgi:hypothetical protein
MDVPDKGCSNQIKDLRRDIVIKGSSEPVGDVVIRDVLSWHPTPQLFPHPLTPHPSVLRLHLLLCSSLHLFSACIVSPQITGSLTN